ncbi:hypothetical protein ASE49_05180 [Novosphingobium sp. Leaf2]|nr:hypothetical protein ASE49_05180 [Novosphingobium sp. Leaf2]
MSWLAVAWNALLCLDTFLIGSRDRTFLAATTPDTIDWLDSMPIWIMPPWALGACAGLVGALLLLDRSPHAVTAFALSLAGWTLTLAWLAATGLPAGLATPGVVAILAPVWPVAAGLWWFARGRRGEGALR